VGRVTARDATTITVSLTAKAGTAPVDGTSNRTLKIGGRWKGPNGTEDFPFGFVVQALNNGTDLTPRVNLIGSFNVSNAVTHNIADAGPVVWQGAFSTPGDGSFAVINAGASASFTMLTMGSSSCRRQWLQDVVFEAGMTTGAVPAVALTSVIGGARNVLVKNSRGIGLSCTGTGSTYIACEAHNCNQSLNANTPGILIGSSSRWIRCSAIANGRDGFGTGAGASINPTLENCISMSNSAAGYSFKAPTGTAGSSLTMIHCDAFSNAGDGLLIEAATLGGKVFLENCNFVNNSGWGVNQNDALSHLLLMRNCAFPVGAYANTLGDVNVPATTNGVHADLTVNYPTGQLPWVDAVNGNFTAAGPSRRAAYAAFAANSQYMRTTLATRDLAAIQGPGNPDTFIARPSVLIRR
jgi:hypothetical protein